MSFNFVIPEFNIGGTGTPPLQFFRRGFNLGGSASIDWREVTLSGVGALTLTNALAGSLLSLKLFGGTSQRNLPVGYTQLEYIESDGTQYIDTGYKPNGNTSIDIKFETSASLHFVFGSRKGITGDDQQRFCLYVSDNGSHFNPQYASRNYSGVGTFALSTVYQVQMSQNGFVVDGITEQVFSPQDFTGENNLILFGNNTNGTIVSAQNKIYYFKIYENNTLVGNFIPARRKSDNVLGMYDTVTGTFFTNDGTGTFTAGAEAVPSPDTPMDIVSNNGVLKYGFNYYSYNVTRQLSVENYPVELDRSISYSDGVLTCGITGSVSSNRGMYPTWDIHFTGGHKYACVVMAKGDSRINLGLASIIPSGSVTGGSSPDGFYTLTSNYVWYAKLWECNTDSSARLNIRVAGTDVGQYASFKDILVIDLTAIFGTGNEPTTSSDIIQSTVKIYTDGTVETVEITGKNLFDEQWNRNTGTSTAAATWGQVVTASGWSTSSLIPVKEGQQYTVSYNTTVQIYVFYYESDGTMQQSYDTVSATKKTFTVPSGAVNVRLQVNKSTESAIAALETQFELGSTATTYEPYYNGGSATAEMLLAISSYQDIQSVLDGEVSRSVGIKVLDGSENVALYNASLNIFNVVVDIYYANGSQLVGLCSHYSYSTSTASPGMRDKSILPRASKTSILLRDTSFSTADAVKQFLADQYAQGTPVIIVYPLATATTESATAQPLTIQEGTNIVEITEASMDNLELEVSYKGKEGE